LSDPRWVREWPGFEKALKEKLQRGYEEHTDESFCRTPEDLIAELMQEAVDFAGWGMVFYVRMKSALGHLEDLRQHFSQLQEGAKKPE